MTFPIDHLSASFIKAYKECHLKGKLYKAKVPSAIPKEYAEVGTAVHNAIERVFDTEAEVYVPNEELMTEPMVKRFKESLEGFRMIHRRNPRMINGTPEYYFEWEIEDGIVLIGFIDLYTRKDDTIFIDDWKTGAEKESDLLQMEIYSRAMSEITGIPLRNIAANLHYLRAAKTIQVRPDRDIKRWIYSEIINPIKKGDWTPNRAKCDTCEYRNFCPRDSF